MFSILNNAADLSLNRKFKKIHILVGDFSSFQNWPTLKDVKKNH